MGAAWALTARAFSWTRSLWPEENSWLVVMPLGAIPCSLKSYQTKRTKETQPLDPSRAETHSGPTPPPRYLLVHEVFWLRTSLLRFLLP